MIKFTLVFCTFLIILSCNEVNLKGKIDIRKDGNFVNENDFRSIYLINTSIDKSYEFTIKGTKIINDSSYSYETFKKSLSPGDEVKIGNNHWFEKIEYLKKVDYLILPDDYKILPYKIDSLDNIGINKLSDFVTKLFKQGLTEKQLDFSIAVFSLHYNFNKFKGNQNSTDTSLYYIFKATNGTLSITNTINTDRIKRLFNNDSQKLMISPEINDTIINNLSKKFIKNLTNLDDSLKPKRRIEIKNYFECKGQTEIKNKTN